MSAHGFKSVFMAGGIAAAALGCYLVSLRVASERAALEAVENKIVLAQRDIRLLSTEIGTRGRLAQLERWNVKVIRLSAPSADQFVESSFQLATLAKPEPKPALEAPLIYAAAPAPERREPVVTNDDGRVEAPVRTSRPVADMMHVANYSKPEPKALVAAIKPAEKKTPSAVGPAGKPATIGAKPKPKPAAAAAKPVKSETVDPLGPLSVSPPKAKSDSGAEARESRPATTRTTKTTKDSGSSR